MKKMIGVVAGLMVSAAVVLAGSPSQMTGTVVTNGTSLSIPASGSMAYKLQAVVFGADASTTQTVSLVQSGITNQIATKVVSATDRMLSVTNGPWMFAGDLVRITTTATNSYTVLLVGETGN